MGAPSVPPAFLASSWSWLGSALGDTMNRGQDRWRVGGVGQRNLEGPHPAVGLGASQSCSRGH